LLVATTGLGFIPHVNWITLSSGASEHSAGPWTEVNAKLQRRAAVDLEDDFRHGLGEWRSRSNTPAPWSFDEVGFVHPGRLALYRPTLQLTDYRLEFDAQLEEQAIGFVFRALDFDNYYAVKLVNARSKPSRAIEVVRYAVIKGREGPHTVYPLPVNGPLNITRQVRLDIRGSDFTLITQGKIADHWSDTRLTRGGVGFFCGKGDKARLGRVEISYQNDALGKLCAYIAPMGQPDQVASR
jgi:hypothetical protein